MVKVNLCVRDPKEYLNYIQFKPMNVNPHVNFQMESLLEEVKELPKARRKEYKKIAASFLITLSSIMPLGSRSMASTLQQSSSSPVLPATTLPTAQVGMPPELTQFLSGSLVMMVAIAVVLCIGMLIAAGVLRALRKRREASEWTVDIIKGLTQIILAAPLVFLIYFVATMLFNGTGWFISPFAIK